MRRSTTTAIAVTAFVALSPAAWAAEPDPASRAGDVVLGPHYKAGPIHRWLWGTDYRRLWTAPTHIEVLDLESFAGGLEPVARVGGRQTKGLALRGGDGRGYTFRGVDKDPTSLLPEELQDTWARGLVQDQIAASHPASFLVADELMKAAGILRTEQSLVRMPDDPRLGEFRNEFAGVVGQLYAFPSAASARNPGFQGAIEVLDHREFHRRIAADPKDRADTRAFLKARLFDILVGDWDRHRDQWRWARFAGSDAWQPIPDDRDQAFSRYEGLVLALSRPRLRRFQDYGPSYPGMKGLTWNGWEQDRQLLSGLERSTWTEVAVELRSQITDEVIARAVRRMPGEYSELDGARLIRDLTARRDGLGAAADAFYRHLADKVKVVLTEAPEYVEVTRLDGGEAQVRVWRLPADGTPAEPPLFRRTFLGKETEEIQIDLHGGHDRVVTLGRPNGIHVRVIGGGGTAVVDDSKGGGTRFSDDGRGELRPGPGSRLDRRAYTPPPAPRNAPWIQPRDWGRDTFLMPWLSYGSDIGALTGVVVDTQAFGFRKDPYASRHVLRAGWAFGESTFRADYRADFRAENRRWHWGWYGYASGTEATRFFGFGNETSDGGDPTADGFRARQEQFAFTPTLTLPTGSAVSLTVGPTIKYASNRRKDESTLLNSARPYGYGDFGEVGATAVLRLDTRDGSKTPGGVALGNFGHPRRGVHLAVQGQVWPGVWDVEETFGSVKGSGAVYLTPGSDKAPTLALRAGGQRVFGAYPYFEAAYLGGGIGGLGASAGDDPVRGLTQHRYAGDATVYGSADLRVYVSQFRIVLPGTWGLLAFGDVGRVYLDGETSDRWHRGYGAGLWFAWLDRGNTVSASYARSESRTAVYVRAGFAF